jgi:hypothetical protein
MSMKGSGEATDWETIDESDAGFGWLPYPDEDMQRACHALAVDGDVWLVDPVDVPGLDDEIAAYGDVAGVLVGLDRHKRDAAAIADRHDVPVFLPAPLADVAADLDAPTETFTGTVPGTDYRTITVVDTFYWTEVAFWDEETLLVPESVGTVAYMCAEGERLGVHPMRRAFPPRGPLGGLDPDHIRVGHGAGVTADPAAALDDALRGSRRRMLGLYTKIGMDAIGLS